MTIGGKNLQRMWAHDIGVDLGTANTLVFVRGKGIVINEPSFVAINHKTKGIIAIGSEAKRMVGKTPKGIISVRPLVDGVVSDFEATEHMLKHFVSQVHQKQSVIWPRPRMVIGIPSGVTEVEKRAVEEAAHNAGAREVFLIEEPMAGAIGIGLPVKEAHGSLIVDIGGGTTEVALISYGGIVVSKSLRVAGDELTEAIIQHVRDDHGLLIGESTAENIKLEIGSVYPEDNSRHMIVRGRNVYTSMPQEITLLTEHVRIPLVKHIRPLVEAIRQILEESPPDLAADVLQGGINLTGGGALIRGLDKLIEQDTKVPVIVSKHALVAVAKGTGKVLENINDYRGVLQNSNGG